MEVGGNIHPDLKNGCSHEWYHRAFVGIPLCRNENWLTISMMFIRDIVLTIYKLGSIPKLIRPLYAWIFNPVELINSLTKKAWTLLAPVIHRRFEEKKLAQENGVCS